MLKRTRGTVPNKKGVNIGKITYVITRDIRMQVERVSIGGFASKQKPKSIMDESIIFEKTINFYENKLHSTNNNIRLKGFRQSVSKEALSESLKQYILDKLKRIPLEYFKEASFINPEVSSKKALVKVVTDIFNNYIEDDATTELWDMMIQDIKHALTSHIKDTTYGRNKNVRTPRALGSRVRSKRTHVGYQGMYNYDDTKDYVIYPLLYATSRNLIRDEDKNIIGYGTNRDLLNYGKCEVKIEKSNKLGGKLNKSFLLKVWDAWMDNDDDNRKVSLESLDGLSISSFNVELEFLYTTANEDEMLLYIHGYNNSFEDAATRAAQIAYDLKFPGVTSFFSWASKNTFSGYGADAATSEISVKYLYDYILNIWRHSSTKKIHILSHSMGNRIFMNVLRKIKENDIDIKFGHIILVAPDVDKELFEEYSYLYNKYSEMSTLYVSSEDKAVRASYHIHQNNRVGLSPPVVVEKGIDTIHADSVIDRALWDLGHSYYAEAEALISDMHELLTSSVEAKKRQKLQKVEVLDKKYWQLNLV